MKKVKMIILAALSVSALTGIQAQTLYDASRLLDNDLNGTARFVGMGGAMGALGGDISTMGTNPAGIGIYRSNDAMISFGFKSLNTESKLGSSKNETDKFRGSFDNLGFVFSNKIGNRTALKYVNFGFNYHKAKSFDKDMVMGGNYNVSQTQQIAGLVNANSAYYGEYLSPEVLLDKNAFNFGDVPWLGALAYESNLIVPGQNQKYNPYLLNGHSVDGYYRSRERGQIAAYDFNVALNWYDRIYLGATLTAYSVDYSKSSIYQETFLSNNQDDGNYALRNYYDLDGSGVDFKLGLIVRPFEQSPLRIGLAVHTPTFYNLEERNSSYLDYDTYNETEGKFLKCTTYTQNQYGDEMEGSTKYKLTTPWKYNFSLGYTIGQSVALGAEYEYSDYSTSKLEYDDGVNMDYENSTIKQSLKGVSTVRLGAEIKLSPEFSSRIGYNHISAPIKTTAFKELSVNAIRTDTEFSNRKSRDNYTIGFGYRGSSFYADLAYQYSTYKEDFYAFDNVDLPATKITNSNSQVLMTLGVRF